jgi:hypothetical protein
MANTWSSRLVTANTRVVSTRKTGGIVTMAVTAASSWGDMMTSGVCQSSQSIARTERSAVALYRDMADEPWKYSDEDMFAWQELDKALRAGPHRAQVESYWRDRDVLLQDERARVEKNRQAVMNANRAMFRMVANEAARVSMKRRIERDIKRVVNRFNGSATKIQALVRGYQTRCRNPHLDCCMCLSHRISPLKTDVGNMCRDCATLGPYEDIVENDPWNWHRC